MSSTVTLSLHPENSEYTLISSPFAAKDVIRSLPDRRWNPERKCWVIPTHAWNAAKAVLEDAGFDVVGLTPVERDLRRAKERIRTLERELRAPRARPRTPSAPSGDPFAYLSQSLPENLRGPVYRALIRVLHPDTGGTTELAQRLNDSPLARR